MSVVVTHVAPLRSTCVCAHTHAHRDILARVLLPHTHSQPLHLQRPGVAAQPGCFCAKPWGSHSSTAVSAPDRPLTPGACQEPAVVNTGSPGSCPLCEQSQARPPGQLLPEPQQRGTPPCRPTRPAVRHWPVGTGGSLAPRHRPSAGSVHPGCASRQRGRRFPRSHSCQPLGQLTARLLASPRGRLCAIQATRKPA